MRHDLKCNDKTKKEIKKKCVEPELVAVLKDQISEDEMKNSLEVLACFLIEYWRKNHGSCNAN